MSDFEIDGQRYRFVENVGTLKKYRFECAICGRSGTVIRSVDDPGRMKRRCDAHAMPGVSVGSELEAVLIEMHGYRVAEGSYLQALREEGVAPLASVRFVKGVAPGAIVMGRGTLEAKIFIALSDSYDDATDGFPAKGATVTRVRAELAKTGDGDIPDATVRTLLNRMLKRRIVQTFGDGYWTVTTAGWRAYHKAHEDPAIFEEMENDPCFAKVTKATAAKAGPKIGLFD